MNARMLIQLAALSVVIGCGLDDAEDRPHVTSAEQSILDGTEVDPSSEIAANLITVGPPNSCSGVALDAEWVLTARHCLPALMQVDNLDPLAPQIDSTDTREAWVHGVEDLALVRAHPFWPYEPLELRLWNRDLAPLMSSSLFCAGQGDNTLEGTGSGTWRWASMQPRPYGLTADQYRFDWSQGDAMAPGDSGGPCLKYMDGAYHVTGITYGAGDIEDLGDRWSYQVALTPAISGWIEDIRQRSRLFFYRARDGHAFSAALERNGTYTTRGSLGGFGPWSHVTLARNGMLVFYDWNTGNVAIGRLGKDGWYETLGYDHVDAGYTHAVAVGRTGVFFYSSYTGKARPTRVESDGGFIQGIVVSGFRTAWSNIVGTKDGALFFYKYGDGTGATGTIDETNLTYANGAWLTGFSKWSHVTPVNERGVFFYDFTAGVGFTAEITRSGTYQSKNYVSGIGGGYQVVGATNGSLLFRNAAGSGKLARVDAWGTYTALSTVSGFATDWSHVVAE